MLGLSRTARRRYPSEEYPEDVAFQRLVEWGFRGNFAIRWANGNVATYKRIPWPEIDAKELALPHWPQPAQSTSRRQSLRGRVRQKLLELR